MERFQGSKYQRQVGEMIDELDAWLRVASSQIEAWERTRTRSAAAAKMQARRRWVLSGVELLEQAHSAMKQAKLAGN